METETLTSQADVDRAIAAGATRIEINTPAYPRIEMDPPKPITVVLWGNSRAVLWGNSSADLRGNSSAVLWGNSRAVLWGNSRAVLRGNSRAVLWDNSSADLWGNSRADLWGNSSAVLWGNSRAVLWGNSRAVLRGNSSAVLRDNSSADLWDNSRAVLRGNSSAVLWDNSSAVLRDNSRAVLRGNSSAVLWDNSSAEATSGAVLFKHDKTATAKGGVQIDNTKRDLSDPVQWCEFHGVKVSRAGIATIYKAVDDNWTTDRGTSYAPGSKPSAPDWRDDNSCGGGLHFSPSPKHAKDYHPEATKFVAVGVRVSDLRPILGGTAKCKAPAVVRGCVAVDDRGNKL